MPVYLYRSCLLERTNPLLFYSGAIAAYFQNAARLLLLSVSSTHQFQKEDPSLRLELRLVERLLLYSQKSFSPPPA
jgi:hypothetical protein